ncbi:MAG: 6-carboxytetrahydropterin synthase [Cytophagaceae bacterium]|nr:6-carboxytetrahydropterin synthase [Cytophagaceae bacterium]MBK9511221.1 6-carboxytetrahydropterin synthase [Cytophagaceae bacterium]MBK9933410.1 6-carboxytetrahydropterin synthase [Cytophagaceae bacterium]MBL0302873.1 6-carboxytetrahydropterin synthase [Cytophagaceae bacterium]MBL0325703.1 6-carboxytetrahydropterin synthase [Cytophagaceae bacterium]
MIQITRREHFNAAHRLFNPKWSEEKNWEVFGICSRVHGHNWQLFVTVEGEIDQDHGWVMDLKVLRDIMREHVTNKFDHSYLNDNKEYFEGIMPSVENFAIVIFNILEPILKSQFGVKLIKVKLIETENHSAEYFGK